MRIELDVDACVGHGRCYALATEVFDADDVGHCVIKITDDLPPDLVELARTGVSNCPEDALKIVD
jgi:ferredoxin